jgi:glutaminyl-peptide cyclotransferase
LSIRVLVAALAVQLLLGGAIVYGAIVGFPFFGGSAARRSNVATSVGTPVPTTSNFDSARAFALTREQVDVGPRPAGSPALRHLAVHLRTLLPNGRFEALPKGLRNIVGSLPGTGKAIVVGAHYDTLETIPHFVGANDSAAGTAVLLELARDLRHTKRAAGAPPIVFALFDGEEEPRGGKDFDTSALRGSRAYVRAHRHTTRELILLDYVGNKDIQLPLEPNSTRSLWERMRAAAHRVGESRVFRDNYGPSLLDDHTPFLDAGIPAIDLIDFSYRYAHTPQDTLDKISPRALDAVGEAVYALVLSESHR